MSTAMLFSLANLPKRSLRDHADELALMPRLLHGRSVLKLLEQAIAAFDAYLGRPRREYDPRALESIMGNYRLGRCVEACLLTRYAFTQLQIESILSEEQISALVERGLGTPSEMRLALWDRANAYYGGFVPPAERQAFLAAFAQDCGLPPDAELVDSLLTLDSEAATVLTLQGERPTAREVMRLYNRGAVQTLLAHSTLVRFDVSSLPGSGLKRLYFVAKRRGVLVDIEQTTAGYSLTLYGPEQAAGSADKYGRRLADVSLSLLRSLLAVGDRTSDEIAATAYLILHDREYRFHITPEVMQRLEYTPEKPSASDKHRVAEERASYSVGSVVAPAEDESAEEPSFDSLVEARLYREFKSLERQGYTHGWLLQREPDPLLAPGVVLIPDFAFVRGGTRVFMEIAGFWSPGYREKKLAKLRTLSHGSDDTNLIIAAPHDAVSAYSGLPYPSVPYKNSVRATDMLTLLDARFGNRDERQDAAQSQIEHLQQAALERGVVPEREVAGALQSYSRTELLDTARSLDGEGCRYVPGVGLLSEGAIYNVHASLSSRLAACDGRLDLQEAASLAASALCIPQVDIEALAQLWPEWRIDRPSLFEACLVTS